MQFEFDSESHGKSWKSFKQKMIESEGERPLSCVRRFQVRNAGPDGVTKCHTFIFIQDPVEIGAFLDKTGVTFLWV